MLGSFFDIIMKATIDVVSDLAQRMQRAIEFASARISRRQSTLQ
jgi:hypothetical protein